METVVIDGSQGEGGGQIVRTSLTLAMLLGKPIEIVNVRAKRKKPGLLRQHLACALAAAEICGGNLQGAELGSQQFRFTPGKINAGEYRFRIATAGSTVLLAQTLLPALALADAPSRIYFEGGTHNDLSPSLCFLQHSYLPLLTRMGVTTEIQRELVGFNPSGGGKWTLDILPTQQLMPLNLDTPLLPVETEEGKAPIQMMPSQTPDSHFKIKVLVNGLSPDVAAAEIAAVRESRRWKHAAEEVAHVQATGPGNSLQIHIPTSSHTHLFEFFGAYGRPAQQVAKRAAGRAKQFLRSDVTVEHYLADQLLLPLALAGDSHFTTTKPSLHTETNAKIIKQLTGCEITIQALNGTQWHISTTQKVRR
ncbi:RNA 3'-terminal phosphate cyclase [Thaumasiovibrio subtropicus]|uniref:RNA 3'-terminal phosphate cyclase n=1 Tax=Thaumasiovibrio subtropicus TaxID=1891207 RepID=UPI00131B472E|nr:RNA 3'-terminal phosphate cyclase [Thaumasiovibrio subtropicus]